MKRKIRLGLLFGGRSGEHEVSLQSAKSVYESLDKDKYDIKLIGIDKKGRWLLENKATYLLNPHNAKTIALNTIKAKEIVPTNVNEQSIDVIFPVMHGTYGEDGSIQGLLELLNVAYVGAGVLGSAVGMDKDVMKRLLNEANIKTTKYRALKSQEATDKTLNDVVKLFQYPLFVKPANLGSSVGVQKVENMSQLKQSVTDAFTYDTKILIEQAVEGREIECSVLGNDEPVASIPGEVIPHHQFYSYEAKYLDQDGASFKIPADLPLAVSKKVQETAVKAFKVLECAGMARVDFFVTKRGEVIVNEINTIPGFTSISMYPKLWKASGLEYSDLLDRLIEYAVERKKAKDNLKRSYEV